MHKQRISPPIEFLTFRPLLQTASESSEVDSMLEYLECSARRLLPGDRVNSVLIEWERYQSCMKAHLTKIEKALPSQHECFTSRDFKILNREIVKQCGSEGTGSLVYFCSSDSFCNCFMVQGGIPQVLWYIMFRFKYCDFKKRFAENLEAVKTGQEQRSIWSAFFWWNLMDWNDPHIDRELAIISNQLLPYR
jgi:hypothetical protein